MLRLRSALDPTVVAYIAGGGGQGAGAHGVTSRLKSKSRAVFLCYPTLNNCRQPESLLRMNDNDNHLQMGGEDVAFATSSPPKQGNRIKI